MPPCLAWCTNSSGGEKEEEEPPPPSLLRSAWSCGSFAPCRCILARAMWKLKTSMSKARMGDGPQGGFAAVQRGPPEPLHAPGVVAHDALAAGAQLGVGGVVDRRFEQGDGGQEVL